MVDVDVRLNTIIDCWKADQSKQAGRTTRVRNFGFSKIGAGSSAWPLLQASHSLLLRRREELFINMVLI